MLAAWLAILLTAEVAVLYLIGAALLGAHHSLGAAIAGCLALACAWRAALVASTMVVARVDRGLGARDGAARCRAWVSIWARECWAMTTGYLAMTLEPLRPAPRALAQSSDDPVIVFVHGWLCNAGAWRPLMRRVQRSGMAQMCCVTLRPVLGSIDDMARSLDRQLPPLSGSGGQRRIVLVTHSMGGLVARAWLRQLKATDRGRVTLLTIACPHGGTRLALLGPGVAARQMRPGSAWLAERPVDPETLRRTTCVASWTDNFVAPQESAELPGARTVIVPAVGHFGLIAARATADCVLEAWFAARARAVW
jgi:pimeloyl-ACP methyl ester carboxylesterase